MGRRSSRLVELAVPRQRPSSALEQLDTLLTGVAQEAAGWLRVSGRSPGLVHEAAVALRVESGRGLL